MRHLLAALTPLAWFLCGDKNVPIRFLRFRGSLVPLSFACVAPLLPHLIPALAGPPQEPPCQWGALAGLGRVPRG